mmetsp:Transcript_11052/g.23699  ORF Transcript_11052/g.23699 Transcript_11052/m.23699 type:complete len:398 (-) Transcript_11052:325-1518(-)
MSARRSSSCCGCARCGRVDRAAARLFRESRELWVPSSSTIARVDARFLTPLEFHQQFVSRNCPVILTHAMHNWPAMKTWTSVHSLLLTNRIHPNTLVSVNCSPDGRADRVRRDLNLFVKPAKRSIPFSLFTRLVTAQSNHQHKPSYHAPKSNKDNTAAAVDGGGNDDGDADGDEEYGVVYMSEQDDVLRREFGELMEDVSEVGVARDVFGGRLDAVNLWIGSGAAESALHKDHYENIYCVLSGAKQFTLLPPCDAVFLREKRWKQGTYRFDRASRRWTVDVDEGDDEVPWVEEEVEEVEEAVGGRLIKVVVGRGEALYLPALWFHHVTHVEPTIAVNFWYDMDFNAPLYVLSKFLRNATRAESDASSPSPSSQSSSSSSFNSCQDEDDNDDGEHAAF